MTRWGLLTLIAFGAFFVFLSPCEKGVCQSDGGAVKIKINRIVFDRKNSYAFYIPSFEFHIFFQQDFNVIRSAITADYDYRRQDMGFGMSHALNKYIVKPGITVEDNLFFREVFTDSTGIWNRSQAITPFIIHELSKNATTGMEFKFQRDWSPKRRMGAQIINSYDRALKVYYLYNYTGKNAYNNMMYFLSFEKSYKLFGGDFNYLLLELLLKHSMEFNKFIRYKGIFSFRGNLTPQTSPLYFLGGRSNLIGYENDEFWGRRVFYIQNLFEVKPFPRFILTVKKANLRRLAILCQVDVGRVQGAPVFSDLRPQPKDVKMGYGIGLGCNTDLPYMPSTDLHLMIAVPNDNAGVKFYAGFGGWFN